MTYELAKELKDAGFPEQTRIAAEMNLRRYYPMTPPEAPSFPLLQELIEETKNIATLDTGIIWDCEDEEWVAFHGLKDGHWIEIGAGNTPEEAVARLWLALNTRI